jgi:hypothetical protein
MQNKQEKIRVVTEYFTGDRSILPPDLSQLCLEFAGTLRIGLRSLIFVTYNIPTFQGKLHRRFRLQNFMKEKKQIRSTKYLL